MAEEKTESSSGNEDVNELGALLKSSAREFKIRPHTTDDELDDLMASADHQAAQKSAGNFEAMLQQMVQLQEEKLRNNEAKAELVGIAAGLDEETKQIMEVMKKPLSCRGQDANEKLGDEFIAGMDLFGSLEGNMEPFMSMIMESFISKDVMYPLLKEIYSNYPKYLREHCGELDSETLERFQKQLEVLGKVCTEFEKQPDASPEVWENIGDVASAAQIPDMSNLEVLGKLLTELQSLGLPPKELTEEIHKEWVDDVSGMSKLENVQQAADDACSIM